MGSRFAGLQDYIAQAGSLQVVGRIGGELSSGFSMFINGMQRVGDNGMILTSASGEILINEEEIYRISPVNPDGSFTLYMDGGTELRFMPAGIFVGGI